MVSENDADTSRPDKIAKLVLVTVQKYGLAIHTPAPG